MTASKSERTTGYKTVPNKGRGIQVTASGKSPSSRAAKSAGKVLPSDLATLGTIISHDGATGRIFGQIVKKMRVRSKETASPVVLRLEIRPDLSARVEVDDGSADLRSVASDETRDLDTALAAARARGRDAVARIVAGPDMLNADAMADRLGVSRMTVNTWRDKGVLLGLAGPKRGFRFPDWQLDDAGRPYAELATLHDLLGDPWAVYRFLVQPQGELDGATGLQALQAGRGSAALAAAESIGRDFG